MKKERNFNRRYAKEYTWMRSLFYALFVRLFIDNYMRAYYDSNIYGKENLPTDGGKYIYAGNHISTLDPPIVSFSTHKIIAFMAKAELFEPHEKQSWLIKRLGTFAVNRTKPEIATFKTVRDIFTTTWSLGVFPQGGIHPYGDLDNIKKGFAVIAKNAKADIIPIAIADFEECHKKRPFKKGKFNVYIGTPISHKLPAEEIIYEWCKHISKWADYNNGATLPECNNAKATV